MTEQTDSRTPKSVRMSLCNLPCRLCFSTVSKSQHSCLLELAAVLGRENQSLCKWWKTKLHHSVWLFPAALAQRTVLVFLMILILFPILKTHYHFPQALSKVNKEAFARSFSTSGTQCCVKWPHICTCSVSPQKYKFTFPQLATLVVSLRPSQMYQTNGRYDICLFEIY